ADELLWTTESPQRGVIPDRSGSFCGGTVIIEQQFSVLFRGKESWSNRVNPHALVSPFAREELGQIKHGGLGSRVGHHPGQGDMARHAGDVDDTPLAPG